MLEYTTSGGSRPFGGPRKWLYVRDVSALTDGEFASRTDRCGQEFPPDHLGASHTGASVLEDHRDGVSWRVRAREADEPGMGLLALDFGGPRLAADPQTGDRRGRGVAGGHRADHHLLDLGRRRGRDGGPVHRGVGPIQDGAVPGGDTLDQVGPHHLAAVGDGGGNHCHMQWVGE